jgi:hypothetical protein
MADGAIRRIPLADIVLIGEHTAMGGPYVEDYWLSLVLRDGQSLDIGSEDPASALLYAMLGNALAGSPLVPGLCNPVQFRQSDPVAKRTRRRTAAGTLWRCDRRPRMEHGRSQAAGGSRLSLPSVPTRPG